MAGQTPQQLHTASPATYLPADFRLPQTKQPLYEGRLHFMRAVDPQGSVLVLNSRWTVPQAQAHPAVWVTLEFQLSGATLSIYDAAPDCDQRTCLGAYPFPVSEPILPRPELKTQPAQAAPTATLTTQASQPLPEPDPDLILVRLPQQMLELSQRFWWASLNTTTQLARQVVDTMY